MRTPKAPADGSTQTHVGRVPELDGIRGLAILMVIVWHYFYSQIHPARHSALAWGALPFSLCWSGVDLFFVLSGFLIGGNLFDSRGDRNYFAVFYVRRICRLGPVYFLVLAAYGASYLSWSHRAAVSWLSTLLGDPMPALSYVTFTQNIFMGIRNTFGATWMAPTWSLAVEEQFYLVLPALVSVLSPKALRRVIVVAIVTAPAFRAAASALVGQVEMPMRADSLLLGVMVALCVRDARFVERLRRNVRAYYAAFVLLLLGAAVMCVKGSWFGVFTQTWLAATYATLLLAPFADAAGLSRVLRANALRFFGKLSYSLYLTHLIVAGLLHGLVYGREPRIDDLGSAALTTGSFLLSVGISYALFRSIETPAIAYGHRRVKRVGIAATA